MNAVEKIALDRAFRLARPSDIEMQAVSSVGGTKAINDSIKAIEATVTRFQKAGSEILLVAIKR